MLIFGKCFFLLVLGLLSLIFAYMVFGLRMTDSPGTLVPAGLAEAKGDQVTHAQLAHVAECHLRTG